MDDFKILGYNYFYDDTFWSKPALDSSMFDTLRYAWNGTSAPVMFDDSSVTMEEVECNYIKFLKSFEISNELCQENNQASQI